ncbi:MAG: hypothetical protein WDA18_06900 [Candidatus Ratteibacteria bacterium]
MRDRALLVIFLITASIAFSAPHSSTRDILKRNIFADPPPSPRLTMPILRQDPVLPLEKVLLVKGIIFTPSGESKAIIERIEKKQEELLEIGDIIENSRITRIDSTSVFFERDGRSVELFLTRESIPLQDVALAGTQVAVPRKVPVSSPSARSILRNPVMPVSSGALDSPSPQESLPPVDLDFDEALQSLKSDPGLLASLNIAPYMHDGKVNGFIVNNIPSNSLPSQLGIRNGDVVQRVNGVLIDSVNRGYQLFSTLSSSRTSSVTVEILRSGNPLTLTYRNVK